MSNSASGPAYRVETPRTVLRCWNPEDAPLLHTAILASLDHLRPWMPWAHLEPSSLDERIERLRTFRGEFDLGRDFVYGIFNRDETSVLGGTGLHTRQGDDAREIGYWIHKDFLNQGLATEISAALTRVAFTIDRTQRVEIHCASENLRSAAVPRKLGFQHDGTLRRSLTFQNAAPRDRMIWTMLREEFDASPAASTEIVAYDVIGRTIADSRHAGRR
jgi:RimJ/RimL family protein N-acetyltransferase